MRLMLIANDFPSPVDRNRGIFNRNLAAALARDHEVRVICPVPWIDELGARWRGAAALRNGRHAALDGLDVHYPRYVYPPKIWRRSYAWFYWQSVRRTVRRVLEGFEVDAVIGYWVHPDGQAAVRAARIAGVPSAIIVGGSDVLLATRNPARRRCIANVLQSTDLVFTVSEHLKTRTVELGIAAEKIRVWRQGVDSARFHPGDRGEARRLLRLPPDERIVLWVGRLAPVKAVDVLLQAIEIVRRQVPRLVLYLIGDGPLRGALEKQAAISGLGDAVRFIGERAYEQLPNWYRAADLVTLSSWSEGLPNVLREAVACGTPFVATRVGGVAEIARQHIDRLVPAGEPETMAQAIADGLRQPPPTGVSVPAVPDWTDSARAMVEILRPMVHQRMAGSASCHVPGPLGSPI